MHDCKECFFNCKEEEDFLFSHLNKDMEVLEWGSGSSTKAISKRVKDVVTIEHDRAYFKLIEAENLHNVKAYHVMPNSIEKRGNCGTLENYRDYINLPKVFKRKFDLIFIDGRARVECAKVAVELLKPNGVILIHDYRNPNPDCDRLEYREVETFLDIQDFAYALYSFKPKNNDWISIGKKLFGEQMPTNKNQKEEKK